MNKPRKPNKFISSKVTKNINNVEDIISLMAETNLGPKDISIGRCEYGGIEAYWYIKKDNPYYERNLKRYEEDLEDYKNELKKLLEEAEKDE